MEQKKFDFLSDIEKDESHKITKKIVCKKIIRQKRSQLGFGFFEKKHESWPFCQHCRIRRAATHRWMIGHGSALKPAMFQGLPVCKVCFGRSEDEIQLSIDDFAARRNDYDGTIGGFSWSEDEN
jgi:hypothetical protein